MHLLSMENLLPGMVLAKTVYDEDGRVLLREGAQLHPEYIVRLKQKGLIGAYVRNDFTDHLDFAEVVSEPTRMDAFKAVRTAMNEVCQGGALTAKEVMTSVKNLIDELISNRKILLALTDLRMTQTYSLNHGVSISIISLLIGLALGYDQIKLKQLGIGALLHDVGKAKLPPAILHKQKLTTAEMELVKQHCEQGFEVLRSHGEISILAAHVAFQHHERFDGTGFPRGLKGEEICEFARIVAVANTFDNLTHNRPGHVSLLPHEAIETMVGDMHGRFDANILAELVRIVAVYPVGALVRLNTGESAIVVRTIKHFPTKPVVKLLTNKDGVGYSFYPEVDLSQERERFILEVTNVTA